MSTQDVLDWLTDLMIPADVERGLPAGSSVGVRRMLREIGNETLGLEHATVVERAAIAQVAVSLRDMTDVQFQELLRVARADIDASIKFIGSVLLKAYYTHPFVRDAIGVGSRAPFPSGYSVYDGDLELLEPVYERGPIYRNVDGER